MFSKLHVNFNGCLGRVLVSTDVINIFKYQILICQLRFGMWCSECSLLDVKNIPKTPSSLQTWFKFGVNRLNRKCRRIRLRTAQTEKLKYGPVQVITKGIRKGCTLYL